MKHRYLAFLFLLGGCAHTTPGVAVAPPQASQGVLETQGHVEAVIVVGNVQLIGADGAKSALYRGEKFAEGNKIVVNKDSNALLVLSNGATLHITENSELEIVKFLQAPFNEQVNGTFLRLTKDPSQSNVELKLTKGRLQAEVKKLNTEAGSTFDLTTPMGPIHLREGGVFSVTATDHSLTMERAYLQMKVTPDVVTTTTTTTTSANGTSTTSTNANINTSDSLTVSLTVDPNTGQITGGNLVGANLSTTAAQDLANTLNDVTNAALAQAGLPAQPEPANVSASAPGSGQKPGQTMATVTVDHSIGGGNVSISWDGKLSQAVVQKLANMFFDTMERSGQSITRINEGFNGSSGQGSITISWKGKLLPATVQALADALNQAANQAQAATTRPTAAADVEPPPWPHGVPELKGRVQAVIVVGDVRLIAANGTATPLQRGQIFEEGSKVVANKDSNALLVFSNGATIHVKAGSVMAVMMFRQAPYDKDAEGTFLRLTKDPSRSNVELKINGDSLQGEVKKLNTAAGSTFIVDTPKGSLHFENGAWQVDQATNGQVPSRG